MYLKSLLSACLSLAYLSGTTATATDLDSLYNPGLIKRGFSLLDARQEPTSSSSTPPTPSSDPNDPNATRVVQIVKVSDDNSTLKFWPESIKANIGDVIQFHFYPKNHTVTESLFAQPCMPLPAANATITRPGQKSGFVPVTADTQFRPIYNMIVNDTKPMWIYCGQVGHCAKGMAMVINQNETDTVKTLANYKAAAAKLAVAGAASGSSSASSAYGAPSTAPSAPPAGSSSAVTATSAGAGSVSTYVPGGPSLMGSSTGTGAPSASIAPFTGDASSDLRVWGSTWSVGLLAFAAGTVGFWL